jgi:hypothetical protein
VIEFVPQFILGFHLVLSQLLVELYNGLSILR